MVKAFYTKEPKHINYMPLPDGMADIRLCTNIKQVTDEDGCISWECDENYFRANMTREYVAQHFDELLEYIPAEPEREPTAEELLLETAADHEMRICLIEMGVNLE